MTKKAKISLISATSLILLGVIIFGGAMMSVNFDFSKLSTVKYVTNTHNIDGEFKDISIVSDTADITFVPSETEESIITCYEQEKTKHSIDIVDGVLNIKIEDTRKWYEHIGITFENQKITVSIPKGEYGKLTVKSSTGNVNIPDSFKFESIDITATTGNVTNNASAFGNINIKTTTGKITLSNINCGGDIWVTLSTGKTVLTNVKCKNLISDGSTGNIDLENVICEDKLQIERDTGHVKFTKCDAGEVKIETSTGNVKGSFLTDKVIIAETGTGNVDIPKTFEGGKCEISTGTGNIKVTIE